MRKVSIIKARLNMFLLEREKWRGQILKQNNKEGFPMGSLLNALLKTSKLPISPKYAKGSIQSDMISPVNAAEGTHCIVNVSLQFCVFQVH